MKKIISIILSAIMMISAVAVCAMPVSAAELSEGNWDVMLSAYEEDSLAEGKDVYTSTPGYQYTDNGFEIVPPTYLNSQARYTAITKTKLDATNFSIKVQIDEFDTSGDCWISFSFWNEHNGLAQGSNPNGEYGYGWSCLIRDAENFGVKDGMFSRFEGFSSGTPSTPGGWNTVGDIDFTPNLVDGKQVLELKVVDKNIYINGVAVPNQNNLALNSAFRGEQGLAYFGISVKSGLKDAPVKFTILEVNGAKPVGSDSKEPVNRGKSYAPIMDASEIAPNTPGVLFDGTLRAQNSKLPVTSQCNATITPEGTFLVEPASDSSCITFDVNADHSVDIKDFPYVGVVVKNYCTCPQEEGTPLAESCVGSESAGFFYFAGDILGADLDHRAAVGSEHMVDITPEGSDDYYILIYLKIPTDVFEDTESRLHGVRLDLGNLLAPYELVYFGFFASPADMVGYTTQRNEGFVVSVEDIDLDYEEGDSGLVEDEDEDEDEYPEDLDEEKTSTTTTAPTTTDDKASGCGSFVGMSAVAMLAIVSACGAVTFKKKKRN